MISCFFATYPRNYFAPPASQNPKARVVAFFTFRNVLKVIHNRCFINIQQHLHHSGWFLRLFIIHRSLNNFKILVIT